MATPTAWIAKPQLTAMGAVALFVPFVLAIGDGLVKGKQCEMERQQLEMMLAEARAAHRGVGDAPERVRIEERIVQVPVPAAPQAASLEPSELGAFAFVWEDRLVLDTDADPRWSYGGVRGEVDSGFGSVAAWRPVQWGADPHLEALSGQSFILYGADGEVCRARLTQPRLEAAITGDFYALLDHEGQDVLEDLVEGPAMQDLTAGKKTTRRRWLEQMLLERVMDSTHNWLTARLQVESGDCSEGLWARAASRPAATVFVLDDSEERSEELRERFRGTEAHQHARRSFDSELAGQEPQLTWVGHESETLSVQAWHARGQVDVELARVGEVGECGEADTFGATAWVGGVEFPEFVVGEAKAVFAIDGVVHALTSSWYGGETLRLHRIGDEDESVYDEASIEFYGCNC